MKKTTQQQDNVQGMDIIGINITIPTLLTILRLLITPGYALCLLYGHIATGLVLFIVASLSDAMDGFLARTFHWQSKLGSLLDPIADKLLVSTSFLVLTFSPKLIFQVPLWLSFTVVFRDVLILLVVTTLYFSLGSLKIAPSSFSKLATVFQMLTIAIVIFENYLFVVKDVNFFKNYLSLAYHITLGVTIISWIHYVYYGLKIFTKSEQKV